MHLLIDVFDAEPGASTYPDNIYDGLLAELDGLLDDDGSGQLSDKPYLAALDM